MRGVDARLHARERAELARVLSSSLFQRAPHPCHILNYLCEKYFSGEADSVKEYSIATEVMSLPPDFPEKKGAVVRVEMHRLRKRLERYYQTEGLGDALRLEILPGQYVPRFVPNLPPAGEEREAILPGEEEQAPGAAHAPGRTAPGIGLRRPIALLQVAGILLVLVVVAVAGFFWVSGRARARTPSAAGAAASPAVAATPPPAMAAQDAVHLLAGSGNRRYIDRSGTAWEADRFFEGGYASHYEGEARPAYVKAAPDSGLFHSYRSGDFAYDIPLKPGFYELRLYFVEHKFGEGTVLGGGEESRTFDVYLNGRLLLWRFDLLADVGQPGVADIKVFRDVEPASDGKVHLRFQSVHDRAMLSALELLPSVKGRILPIRLLAQDNGLTDSNGRVWESDRFFLGGRAAPSQNEITGASDPALYAGERFGNFSYLIPVDSRGRYTLILHFAENFFGPGNAGAADTRRRTFDVYCNGVALLRGFDVLAEAGRPRKAVTKTFRGIAPTATGKLMLQFLPVGHHALVDAIEVLDEGR